MLICRLCLLESDDEEVIISVCDNKQDLAARIKKCVSVEIKKDDNLPTTACSKCVEQVIQWETFYETCHNSERQLKQAKIEADRVKVEIENVFTQQSESCTSSDEESDADDFNDEFFTLCETEVDRKPEFLINLYVCDICNKEFNYCTEYLDHQNAHNGEAVFKCDKCTKVFSFRKELVQHDKNHRNPCPQCGKLILKSSLKLHLVKHTDRHMCEQCSSRFNSKAALAQHIITVHTDIKNHICETCGKKFSSKTAMKVHLKSHSDERLYPCKLCNYAGRTASAVYVHMATHANDFCVCEVCSKTFKSSRNLNDHLRRVHCREKKHICNYCEKKFVDKYMLTVHMRSHTGVRPYRCTLCDKAFIRSDGLKEHMVTHGERITYECNECGKKFASKRSVTRHNCTPGD